MSKHILILGGGYGGLLSALSAREHFGVCKNHADQPFPNPSDHYGIAPSGSRQHRREAVALPLDKLLRGANVDLRIGNVKEIKPDERSVSLDDGGNFTYDALVIALGAETAFFGIPGLQENSFILKSVNDANRLRAHVSPALRNTAKRKQSGRYHRGWRRRLTGVELVGEYADMRSELARKYGIDPQEITLYCVEALLRFCRASLLNWLTARQQACRNAA